MALNKILIIALLIRILSPFISILSFSQWKSISLFSYLVSFNISIIISFIKLAKLIFPYLKLSIIFNLVDKFKSSTNSLIYLDLFSMISAYSPISSFVKS